MTPTACDLEVLHVSRFFHPHMGGTENHIADLAEFTADYGIASSIVTTDRGRGESGPVPCVPVHALPVVGPNWMPIPRSGLAKLRRDIRRCDVVHIHDLRFALELVTVFARSASTPVVLSSHGFIFHTPRLSALKTLAWNTYFRFLLEWPSVIVCVSHADADHCRRVRVSDRVRVIPNPVKLDPFRTTHREKSNGSRLLYFGRLAPNKGIERLAPLVAMERPEWTLTIAGSGEPSFVETLTRYFKDAIRDGRCRFQLDVERDSLKDLFASHDCAVLPSRVEGFGLALVESMATGIPVVASDIPPFREIVAGSPVLLVDFDRPAAVVEAISKVIAGWDGTRARARAETYAWERRGLDFVHLYRSLAGA